VLVPHLHVVTRMNSRLDPSRPPIAMDARPSKSHARRDLALMGGGGAIVLAIVILVSHSHAKKVKAERVAAVEGAWGALEGCLLGDELQANESPASRFRAVQLHIVGTPAAARGDARSGVWPVRCASYARDIEGRSRDVQTGAIELGTSMGALAKALEHDASATSDLRKLMDQTWKDANGAGLESKPGNPESCPKPTTPLVSAEQIHSPSGLRGDLDMANVKPEPSPTQNVRFLIADAKLDGGPVVCSASGTPVTLICAHVGGAAAAQSPGLELVGTTDPAAQPWVFAGDRGELGIFRPSGTLAVTGDRALGSSVVTDGSAWLLVHPHNSASTDVRLLHAPLLGDVPAAQPGLDPVELGDLDDVTLAWSWVVFRAGPHATFPSHLVARSLSATGALGPSIDIGAPTEVDASPPKDGHSHLSACRSGSNLAVRLHGASTDAITFFTGATWTPPVSLSTRGGVLSCDKNVARVTAVGAAPGGGPMVEQSTCSASGCAVSRIGMGDLLADTDVRPRGPGNFAAAELAGKLLIVWDSGPVGGIRMRLAAPDALKVTPDAVLVDTQDDAEKLPVTDVKIVAAVDSAIVVLKTTDGTRVFAVDGHGKVDVLHTRT
jgi:hypothetical protein